MASFGGRWGIAGIAVVLATGLVLLLGGCGVGGGSGGPEESVTVLGVESPLRAPIYNRDGGVLLALVEGEPRVAKVNPETGETTISGIFEDAGENLGLSPEAAGPVYLPQPNLGQVALVSVEDLGVVGSLEAGPSPAEVSVDVGSEILFALSEDGSTVTGVDLETRETLLPPVREVEGRKLLHAPERGLAAEFWVAGPDGVALYEGHPTPLEEVDSIQISAGTLTEDVVKVTRAYVSEAGTDRLVAVGLNPEDKKLEVAAETGVGEPIEHAGVDEKRVYAVTENKLVVLAADNFDGFEDESFDVLQTID